MRQRELRIVASLRAVHRKLDAVFGVLVRLELVHAVIVGLAAPHCGGGRRLARPRELVRSHREGESRVGRSRRLQPVSDALARRDGIRPRPAAGREAVLHEIRPCVGLYVQRRRVIALRSLDDRKRHLAARRLVGVLDLVETRLRETDVVYSRHRRLDERAHVERARDAVRPAFGGHRALRIVDPHEKVRLGSLGREEILLAGRELHLVEAAVDDAVLVSAARSVDIAGLCLGGAADRERARDRVLRGGARPGHPVPQGHALGRARHLEDVRIVGFRINREAARERFVGYANILRAGKSGYLRLGAFKPEHVLRSALEARLEVAESVRRATGRLPCIRAGREHGRHVRDRDERVRRILGLRAGVLDDEVVCARRERQVADRSRSRNHHSLLRVRDREHRVGALVLLKPERVYRVGVCRQAEVVLRILRIERASRTVRHCRDREHRRARRRIIPRVERVGVDARHHRLVALGLPRLDLDIAIGRLAKARDGSEMDGSRTICQRENRIAGSVLGGQLVVDVPSTKIRPLEIDSENAKPGAIRRPCGAVHGERRVVQAESLGNAYANIVGRVLRGSNRKPLAVC